MSWRYKNKNRDSLYHRPSNEPNNVMRFDMSSTKKKPDQIMMDFDDLGSFDIDENHTTAPTVTTSNTKKEFDDGANSLGIAAAKAEEIPTEKVDRVRHPELDRLKFSQMVQFYKEIQTNKGKERKLRLQHFMQKIFQISRDPSFAFTILRLIMPNSDKSRGAYGVNYIKLSAVLGDVFSLSEKDKKMLKFYKRPQTYDQRTTGDFGEVVQSVLQNWSQDSKLSINAVDAALDELANFKNRERNTQVNILRKLFKEASAEEIKWICRLILKDLNLGTSHEVIMALYHSDAVAIFNTTSSLWVICQECVDPNSKQANTLKLFHPVKPMLAGRRNLKNIEQILSGKEYLVETKFDGERIQCHVSHEQIMFFTRNSNNYTNIYEKMIKVVRESLSKTIDCCILDGEMITVQKATGEAIQFGKNKTIALEREEDEDLCICYKVFDIIYLRTKEQNEFFLMNYKLSDRKKILQEILVPSPTRLEVITGTEYSDLNEILTEFNMAIHRNEEGIVVKQLDTLYYPDDRSDKWIKMKGDYYEGIVDTLDLLVIGAYFGEKSYRINGIGDWTDHLTHYLLAVMKRADKINPLSSLCVPFAKVASGFRERDLAEIKIKMRSTWVRSTQSRTLPSFISENWHPSESDKPDAYINSPENSIILEIRATEIIQSAQYPTNLTLRFPRFEKFRRDKDWHECMTISELNELTSNLQRKNANGSDGDSDGGMTGNLVKKNKKSKKTHNNSVADAFEDPRVASKSTVRQNRVMAQFADTDITMVCVESQLFSGFVFNVINLPRDDEDLDAEEKMIENKARLEKMIVQYGGSKVQNDSDNVTHFVADHMDFRVKAIADSYSVSVVSIKWVSDCVKKNQLIDYAPHYLVFAQPELIARNAILYDKYGDPYFRSIDADELSIILNNMIEYESELELLESNTMSEITNLLSQIQIDEQSDTTRAKQPQSQDSHQHSQKKWVNKTFCFYGMQQKMKSEITIDVLRHIVEMQGGNVVFTLPSEESSCVDYIVAFDYEQQSNALIVAYLSRHPNVEIISVDVIKESIS